MKKRSEKTTFYVCRNCGYSFTDKQEFCPFCLEKGKKIKLVEKVVYYPR